MDKHKYSNAELNEIARTYILREKFYEQLRNSIIDEASCVRFRADDLALLHATTFEGIRENADLQVGADAFISALKIAYLLGFQDGSTPKQFLDAVYEANKGLGKTDDYLNFDELYGDDDE